MADPAAVLANNPLFAGAPHVVFQMYHNPTKMARSIKKVFKWIKDHLAAQVEAEGGEPFFVIEWEGKTYTFQFTANGGFFTVLVKPPADGDPMARDGLFVYSFRDLYLLGCVRENMWKLYDDAYLVGSGTEHPGNAAYWGWLGFHGGYFEAMRDLPVGIGPMIYGLRVISNPDSSGMAVRLALYPFIAGIPEAIRFPPWLRYELYLLRRYAAEPLKNPILSIDSCFSEWSNISKRIRRGPEAFIPGHGFETYKDLLLAVFLLLSRPAQNELM